MREEEGGGHVKSQKWEKNAQLFSPRRNSKHFERI
jgi:hypothetical protein